MFTVDTKVLNDISKGFAIPAQPELLLKIQKIMASDDIDVNLLADTIAKDVAVSAAILKTINSPIYGLARSISDIRKSVRYIGVNGIYTLVTSVLLKREFGENKNQAAFTKFWQDANNIAEIMVFLSKKIEYRLSAEKLFSIGLFHDCGIPVMALKYPDYQDIHTLAESTPNKTLPQLEEAQYGVNHATIGYYVASSWRLPKDICQLLLRHHDREFLSTFDGSKIQIEFAILKMAENIVHQLKYFTEHNDWTYLKDSVFSLLSIQPEDYQDMMDDVSELIQV